MLLFFAQHDSNNFNVKAFVNLKGSVCNIWKVFDVLDGVRRDIFIQTVFGYLLDVPRLQGDGLLFHKMFLHQIRSDAVLSPDGIKRLNFRVGDMKMVYDPKEFCLITGLNFGEYSKMIGKKVSEKIKLVTLMQLEIWMSGTILLGVAIYGILPMRTLRIRCQTLKYSVSGFTASFRIWIYEIDMPRLKQWSDTKKLKLVDVNKIFSKTQEGQQPINKMSSGDDAYVYGEQKSVSSPVRDHFRRQDKSSSSMSSSGRSHGRGGHSGKASLEEVLKRLHVLEQQVFMNQEPTEVFVEKVNNEDLWNNIGFEESAELEKRNENASCSRNKFDDNVFDVNDYSEAKEEDDLIITGNVNYYDAYGFDGKEVTLDRLRARNPSKYLCPPYTELHTTPKQKRRPKKKVDIKSTSPVPPPAFVVVHDFSVLRLQPYVACGEVVIQNYLFHSYDVQHHLFNLVLDRDFWSALFGHTHDGWLEAAHITIWNRLLMERRFDSDRHTIMPSNFFVCHVMEEGYDWRAFMAGIATYPNFMVLMSIHSSPNHWLFGELRLASMQVHIYDSLGRGAYEKFNSDGTFTKIEARVADYLDKIDYWAQRNIPRIPLNMRFIFETNVPQQSSRFGDCGIRTFLRCMIPLIYILSDIMIRKSKCYFGSHAMLIGSCVTT
uniref:Ubiquitin-like protease family profile domain-containing protein n=1 Tax=Lactuca sativa TaxID=4236 RepID=A0A9R1WJG5_LACSA|nr:hypothetical protein LSAT_V11C200064120 [Lactuca sativa]